MKHQRLLASAFIALLATTATLVGCKQNQASLTESAASTANPSTTGRVFFIPLDDRPSTFLFVQQLARVGGLKLEVPRRADLGKFLTPGNPEALATWILENTKAGDTALLSADMLAYGGLVASRMAGSNEANAVARLDILKKLAAKGVKVEMFAILPRLSLKTSLDEPADVEAKIRDWAKNPGAPEPTGVDKKWIAEYRAVRARNLAVAKEMVSFVESGVVSRLTFGQDDANSTGLHVQDQNDLRAVIGAMLSKEKNKGHANKIDLIQGADEIGMNVMSGFISRKVNYKPTVKITYSVPEAKDFIPPLESHTLAQMLEDHIKIAGAVEVHNNADVELFIQTPKQIDAFTVYATVPAEVMRTLEDKIAAATTPAEKEKAQQDLKNAKQKNEEATSHPTRVEALVKNISAALEKGQRVALADLAIINRADPVLTETVLKENKIPLWKLEAYAGWNTPANAFGTVISQLVVHHLAETGRVGNDKNMLLESEKTHQAFLIARVVDDYGYQHLVREKVRADEKLTGEKSETIHSTLFDPSSVFTRNHILPWAKALYSNNFYKKTVCIEPINQKFELGDIDIEAYLPWRRTFEVEARLDLKLVSLNQPCNKD